MALDPYYELGIERDASAEDIRAAYRRKAQRVHPDKNPDDPYAATKFAQCQEAYEILIDPERRARYDNGGETTKVDTLEHRAHGLLIKVLIDTLDELRQEQQFEYLSSGFNLIATLRDALGQMSADATQKRRSEDVLIGALEKTLKRFRHKSGGHNLLADVIGARIDKAKELREILVRAIEEIKAALKILSDYEDIPDPESEMMRQYEQISSRGWLKGQRSFLTWPGA